MQASGSAVGLPESGVRVEIVSAAGALLLGVLMIFAIGFVGSAVVHGAAHDTRHSMAFPCH